VLAQSTLTMTNLDTGPRAWYISLMKLVLCLVLVLVAGCGAAAQQECLDALVFAKRNNLVPSNPDDLTLGKAKELVALAGVCLPKDEPAPVAKDGGL
jgi:hypothetical protein